MKNITVSVDDETYRRARINAFKAGERLSRDDAHRRGG
jgi:hypothetical protein